MWPDRKRPYPVSQEAGQHRQSQIRFRRVPARDERSGMLLLLKRAHGFTRFYQLQLALDAARNKRVRYNSQIVSAYRAGTSNEDAAKALSIIQHLALPKGIIPNPTRAKGGKALAGAQAPVSEATRGERDDFLRQKGLTRADVAYTLA